MGVYRAESLERRWLCIEPEERENGHGDQDRCPDAPADTVLGIAGAFLSTAIGQMLGYYSPNQGAGFITATLGALVVLFIWNRLVARRVISDPGA